MIPSSKQGVPWTVRSRWGKCSAEGRVEATGLFGGRQLAIVWDTKLDSRDRVDAVLIQRTCPLAFCHSALTQVNCTVGSRERLFEAVAVDLGTKPRTPWGAACDDSHREERRDRLLVMPRTWGRSSRRRKQGCPVRAPNLSGGSRTAAAGCSC